MPTRSSTGVSGLPMDSPTISASSSPRPYTVSWRRVDHRRRWYNKRLCSAPAIVMAGGIGLTILTALGELLPLLPDEERHLALFHGAERVAEDCEGATPRRDRVPLAS